jgi:hypothetical protein
MTKNRVTFMLVTATAFALTAAGCTSGRSKSDSPAPTSSGQAAAGATSAENASTQRVKGIDDWEGDITGKPAPGSAFTKLQIGMSTKQVTDLIGQPDDQGAYITGKAFIPFYYGSDRNRFESVYKGQGRLIFAGGGLGDVMSGHLIWIIHNANEGSHR